MPLLPLRLRNLLPTSRGASPRLLTAAVVLATMGANSTPVDAASIELAAATFNSGTCGPGTELTPDSHNDWGLWKTTSDVRAGLSFSTTCGLGAGLVTTMAATAVFDQTLMLGAYASSAVPADVNPFTQVVAGARFIDHITMVGGLIGSPGELLLSFDIDGATTSFREGRSWGVLDVGSPNVRIDGAGHFNFRVPFVFGTSQVLTVGLGAYVYGGDNPLPFDKLVYSDFLQTATLSSVAVLDSNGVELPGGRVISDAGLQYGGAPEPVPEPASVFLVGGGLLGLIRRTRNR